MEISQNISPDDIAQFANEVSVVNMSPFVHGLIIFFLKEFGIDFELQPDEGQALNLEEEPATGLSRSSIGIDISSEQPEEFAASFEPSIEPMALSDDTMRSPFGATFGMIAGTGMKET